MGWVASVLSLSMHATFVDLRTQQRSSATAPPRSIATRAVRGNAGARQPGMSLFAGSATGLVHRRDLALSRSGGTATRPACHFGGGTVWCVRVQASPEAVQLIQEQGGKLYVRAKRSRCCHGSLT